MAGPPGDKASDAARWWQAYTLAERDQVDELRRLAAAGDEHARRQLASWLSERAFPYGGPDQAKLGEAIEAIRPLADAGDDAAELWLARWLADSDRLDELRQRADRGSYHAGRLLARCLAKHDLLDELRQRADRGSYHAWREFVKQLAERDVHEELRDLITSADADTRLLIFDAVGGSPPGIKALTVLADTGHKASRMHLGRRLAREGRLDELRQRADNGDEYARHWLDEVLIQWRGVVIAEGLHDPAVINGLRVTKAFITGEGQPLDDDGAEGRWHLYWVDVSGDEIDRIQAETRHGWYAHFWLGERLLVVYDNARFEMHRHDQSTWQSAVDHGLEQGLRREWLDFPTDDSAGTLA